MDNNNFYPYVPIYSQALGIPIDVSKLAKGIYSVKVTSASTTTTQKLLVQ